MLFSLLSNNLPSILIILRRYENLYDLIVFIKLKLFFIFASRHEQISWFQERGGEEERIIVIIN